LKNQQKILENFKGVWLNFRDWKKNHKKWLNCAWDDLDGNELEELVSQYKATLNKSKK